LNFKKEINRYTNSKELGVFRDKPSMLWV